MSSVAGGDEGLLLGGSDGQSADVVVGVYRTCAGRGVVLGDEELVAAVEHVRAVLSEAAM
jgi:hypothetical protein